MRPPYHPSHPERITFAPDPDMANGHDSSAVVARCGQHFTGPARRLCTGSTARELADDFNAHRATYVPAALAGAR